MNLAAEAAEELHLSPSPIKALASMSPREIASDVVSSTIGFVTRYARDALDQAIEIQTNRDTPLGLATLRLVEWAQTGEGMSPREAGDALDLVASTIYASAHLCTGTVLLLERSSDPTLEIEVALNAAACRLALAQGRPVHERWLAAIDGVSPMRIRALVATDVLQRPEIGMRFGGITGASAKKYLKKRGRRGF